MKKIGMMATYPARRKSLLQTLETIAPQMDEIFVYCNGYDYERLAALAGKIAKATTADCAIKLVDQHYGEGDVMDMGKFWALGTVEGFIFLLDDDLLYPGDYAACHIGAISRHGYISTVHGRSLKSELISNYFKDTRTLNYRLPLLEAKRVDIAGTGTVAFCTKYFAPAKVPTSTMLSARGMADVWFSCMARTMHQPIIALPRGANWLRDTQAAANTTSLYTKLKDDTSRHCMMINRIQWGI